MPERTLQHHRTGGLTRRSALACLLAAPAFVGRAQARPRDKLAETGTIRIALYEDHRPFCWRDGATYRGIEVDLAHEIAAFLKVKLDLVVRYAGEDVETDLRANVWRGPLTGGGIADVMMHVPAERAFTARLEHVVVANPYYRHSLALAVDERTEYTPGYDLVNEAPFAVQMKTMSDIFLLGKFQEGSARHLRHFVRIDDAVEAFRRKEVMGVAGTLAQLEGLLHPKPEGVRIYTPPLPPPYRRDWIVGTSVKEDSRDLNYIVADALKMLRANGRFDAIFKAYGVTPNDPTKV